MPRSFDRARQKLEDATSLLDGLEQSRDFIQYRSRFNALVTALRSVTNALKKDGAHIKGFAEWYSPKREEMRTDELLRYIHETRIQDFHVGERTVQANATNVAHFRQEDAGPRPPGASELVIGHEGIFWIVDKGTSRERRVAVRGGGGLWATKVSLARPPFSHLGKQLQRKDPLGIAALALDYLQALVADAIDHFQSPISG